MTYSLGATHALTGSGSIAIDSPRGLLVEVSNIPVGISARFSDPIEYFGLGYVTLGDAHGYAESRPLRHAKSVLYPQSTVWTSASLNLAGGATAVVTELVGGGDGDGLAVYEQTEQPDTSVVGSVWITPE